MKISQATWNKYVKRMSLISKKAGLQMQQWINTNGLNDRRALIEFAAALSEKYGKGAGALACEMYDAVAAAQKMTLPAAEMAELPEIDEIGKAVNGSLKQSDKQVPGVVERMVKQVGADTMLQNAVRDGAYFAWVAVGDTCAYCLMLSAVGWQRAGKNTLKGKHAEHIHAHCDCQYMVDFRGNMTIEGYDPKKIENHIMQSLDQEGQSFGSFNAFINANGRTSGKADRSGLNALRRSLNDKQS